MDLWQTLRDRLDYATFVPTPVAGIERADLRRRDGSPYTMLKNPHGDNGAGRYLRLDPADVQLFELMDGQRTIQDILVAHLETAGVFAIDRLARLTASLRVNGFFGEEPPPLVGQAGDEIAHMELGGQARPVKIGDMHEPGLFCRISGGFVPNDGQFGFHALSLRRGPVRASLESQGPSSERRTKSRRRHP